MTIMHQPWQKFSGPNLAYLMEQYEIYLQDPQAVEASLRELFDTWGSPELITGEEQVQEVPVSRAWIMHKMNVLVQALRLAADIRAYGHLAAHINPLEKQAEDLFKLENYQLSEMDLREIPVELLVPTMKGHLMDGYEAIQYLKRVYTSTIGFEFSHLPKEEQNWFEQKVENDLPEKTLSPERKLELFKVLKAAEYFEQFLGRMYVGQKRFSVEGLESLIPAIDEVVREAAHIGIEHVVIAMAHRGRLNVLAHVLQKPYEALIAQFQGSEWEFGDPDFKETYGKTGDVKYHLGAIRRRVIDGKTVTVTMANNPSHLEFVNPVLQGFARAYQDDRTEKGYAKQDLNKAVAVAVHGDAAFTGQGINFETLNFAQTTAYTTGGTIHIIANNLIGFTAEEHEGRSTRYASDPIKGYGVPVLHVNADDPEAVIFAAQLAVEYRQTFHKDILIDLIGYRRLGHNEQDEPRQTNPVLYQKIDQHPTITTVYKNKLLAEQAFSENEIAEIEKNVQNRIHEAYERIPKDAAAIPALKDITGADYDELPDFKTAVDEKLLITINDEFYNWPEGFHVFEKLKRILERRTENFAMGGKIDWGYAETLAFATILHDGTPIRITGEDSERGTFSHRHLVLNDAVTGAKYSPLHRLSTSKASFDIYNSTLSEGSVLGFEYGYSVMAPETLVLWEAQYGDFANGAQVIIDQFIASGKVKWGEESGLVLLLPHGYEGGGPEHSNARPERFLQLAAENNWTVANLTSAAQYFHILRRQAAMLGTKYVRPLVIMSPKSLLRHPLAMSEIREFTDGRFQPILKQPGIGMDPDQVERLILCTGHVAIDLAQAIKDDQDNTYEWLDIIRIEELYPFPRKEIETALKTYKNLREIVWVQEEPKNMGAYSYIVLQMLDLLPEGMKLSYIGRPEMASTSEGSSKIHKKEQERIVHTALTPIKGRVGV